tara:strand:- start:9065 stop:9244 length:180 start_codon:yes stop_codon:yes gene_type:complete
MYSLSNGSNGQIFAVTFFAKKRKKAAIITTQVNAALGLPRNKSHTYFPHSFKGINHGKN